MESPYDLGDSVAGHEKTLALVNEIAAGYRDVDERQRMLELSAKRFSLAMTGAFAQMVAGGRQFDDVLKSLALRMSDMVVRSALQPVMKSVASSLTGGLDQVFGHLFGASPGTKAAQGAVKPFAGGGVIGMPTYFPLTSGGVGLAGEAGPEAILPLARGRDGRLGVASGGGGANVTIQIVTPDADSFRRSEVYLAGQIARAVARGQRDL